ncbi:MULTISPECIES: AMP-binding protein [Lawsonella]|jgi:putative long-chain-fatty-acid--CoA ligase|uniref:AMP-binding protein n=1 Tax=Lawsonella TaxID=1847725 RepID=UPI0025BC0BBE|nr:MULTISPECIES: AMP-binding protein [Lawsonella]
MSFEVESFFRGTTIDTSLLTTFPDLAEKRVAQIVAGEAEDYPIYRFFDYLQDPQPTPESLTWLSFVTRTKAIAAQLQQVCERGDRVVIMMPQHLDYVTGFFAPLFGGQIAIPAFSPTEPSHAGYLEAILTDAEPKVILTDVKVAGAVRKFLKSVDVKNKPRIIAVEGIEDGMADAWVDPQVEPTDIAYLQYSSGSTRRPTAAEISHHAALCNTLQIIRTLGLKPHMRAVDWIPIFHSMSLIYLFAAPLSYVCLDFMEPAAFLQQPSRWVNALQSINGEDVFSSGPDFAFALAAARGKPEDGQSLDLSNVVALMNGSESVTQSTVDLFNATFGPYGLRSDAMRPSYGMSETTTGAATLESGTPTFIAKVDGHELAEGKFVEIAPEEADKGISQVGVGVPFLNEYAVIVHTEFDENGEYLRRGSEIPDGTIGEIWISGPNLASGYWNRPQETVATFDNELVKALPDDITHTIRQGERVAADTKWLRTGDCGAYYNGQLFITGRVKDLVIVDGRNHVATDIEETVIMAGEGKFLPNTVAAFSVAARELLDSAVNRTNRTIPSDTKGEQLVIVAENNPDNEVEDYAEVFTSVRSLIARRHGVQVADFRIVEQGVIPRTPTQKIKRSACRSAYQNDALNARF